MIALLRHLRTLAGAYALALVVCQVGVVASATIVLASSPRSGALGVAADEECNCDHSTGVMCPMHRRSSSRPAPANGPRWCKGVDGSTYAVIPALGTLALPERVAALVVPAFDSIALVPVADAPLPLDHPPDNPPPRG